MEMEQRAAHHEERQTQSSKKDAKATPACLWRDDGRDAGRGGGRGGGRPATGGVGRGGGRGSGRGGGRDGGGDVGELGGGSGVQTPGRLRRRERPRSSSDAAAGGGGGVRIPGRLRRREPEPAVPSRPLRLRRQCSAKIRAATLAAVLVPRHRPRAATATHPQLTRPGTRWLWTSTARLWTVTTGAICLSVCLSVCLSGLSVRMSV